MTSWEWGPKPELAMSVIDEYQRFREVLDAATIPDPAGRRVYGVPQAVALSEATERLHLALNAEWKMLFTSHGHPTAMPAGVTVWESATPNALGTPVPTDQIRVHRIRIGGDGADAILLAAMAAASAVTAIPVELQHRPQRWMANDVLSSTDLHVLESVTKLLAIREDEEETSLLKTALDAAERNQAKTEAWLKDQEWFKRACQQSEQFKSAQAAVNAALEPLRRLHRRLLKRYSTGYLPGSAAAQELDAVRALMRRTELDTYAAHGLHLKRAPATPAELLREIDAYLHPDEMMSMTGASDAYARETLELWQVAESLRKQDPTLPSLPDRPGQGRDRWRVLRQWSVDACKRLTAAQEPQVVDTPPPPAPSPMPLTPGEKSVWDCLHGRVLNAEALAKVEHANTSVQAVREHVSSIRLKRGVDAIKSRPGWGYWRPDAPPDWDHLTPKRKRRIRPT
jgi:hypothetical protein